MLAQIYVNVPWSYIVAEFQLILHILQKLDFSFYYWHIVRHQTLAVLQALYIPVGIAAVNKPAMFLACSLPRIWEKKFSRNE